MEFIAYQFQNDKKYIYVVCLIKVIEYPTNVGINQKIQVIAIKKMLHSRKEYEEEFVNMILITHHCLRNYFPNLIGNYKLKDGCVSIGFDYELEFIDEFYPEIYDQVELDVCGKCFQQGKILCGH